MPVTQRGDKYWAWYMSQWKPCPRCGMKLWRGKGWHHCCPCEGKGRVTSPQTHCLNGTEHCTCEVTKHSGICCFCRINIPPLHAGLIDKEGAVKSKTLPPKKKEGQDMTMLQELMGLDLKRVDFDEMVGLLAFGDSVVAKYKEHSLEIPERLEENVKALRTEIKRRADDNAEAALKEIEQEEERLKTTAEKKESLAARKAALLQKLGR